MKKLNTIFMYIVLILFSIMSIRAWYGFYTEFLSEQAIANGLVSLIFTLISVLGWVFRKDIIKEIIK